MRLSCDIYTHSPAPTSSTNFLLYPFVLHIRSTNCLGHGHGYDYHPSEMRAPGSTREAVGSRRFAAPEVRASLRSRLRGLVLEGTKGLPRNGGSEATTGLIVFDLPSLTRSDTHVDRCSDPLPWDPLSSPYTCLTCKLPRRSGLPKVSGTVKYVFCCLGRALGRALICNG